MQMLTTVSEEDTGDTAEQDDVDRRSVFVGNVHYRSTPQELQKIFLSGGQINRIIFPAKNFHGTPKGFAYVEFHDEQSAQNSLLLNGSLFRGRQLKVNHKRANVLGLSEGKGKQSTKCGFLGGQGTQQEAVAEVLAQLTHAT